MEELFKELKKKVQGVIVDEENIQYHKKIDRGFIRDTMWIIVLLNLIYVSLMMLLSYVLNNNIPVIIGVIACVGSILYHYGHVNGWIDGYRDGIDSGCIAILNSLIKYFKEVKHHVKK